MEFTHKLAAQVFGAVFILVGLLGFVTPLTPGGQLLGLFGVNALHNLVHILSGAALLAAGSMQNGKMAKNALMIVGIVYVLVTLVGFVNLLGLNGLLMISGFDNYLHLILAVALLGAAYGLKK